ANDSTSALSCYKLGGKNQTNLTSSKRGPIWRFGTEAKWKAVKFHHPAATLTTLVMERTLQMISRLPGVMHRQGPTGGPTCSAFTAFRSKTASSAIFSTYEPTIAGSSLLTRRCCLASLT